MFAMQYGHILRINCSVVVGLPDFLQQNTGDFCLSVTFIKDNMMLFHVYVFVCSLTMAVSVAVCDIFSAKEWCDLENGVRVRSRSLEIHFIDRIRVLIPLS